MTQNYEAVGRLYARFVEVVKVANKVGLYVGGGLDKDGDFQFNVYDKEIEHSVFYSSTCKDVLNDKEAITNAHDEITKLYGATIGYSFAKDEAERIVTEKERADRAAAEFIGSLDGSADGEDDKPEMEF